MENLKKNSVNINFCLYLYVSICIRLYSSVFVFFHLDLPGFAWFAIQCSTTEWQIQANLDKFRQIHQQAGCYSWVQADTGGKFEKKF